MKKNVVVCDSCHLECKEHFIEGTLFKVGHILVSYYLNDVDNCNDHDASHTVNLDFCNPNCMIYYFEHNQMIRKG